MIHKKEDVIHDGSDLETELTSALIQFSNQGPEIIKNFLKSSMKELMKIEQSGHFGDEFKIILLQETIFTSLNVTFYEDLFLRIKNDPKVGDDLVDNFSQNYPFRKEYLEKETDLHLNYILKNGQCTGCDSCQFHGHLDELLEDWTNDDMTRVIITYLGMHCIQSAFEYLVFDVYFKDPFITDHFTMSEINKFRQYLFTYTQNHFKDLDE
jgi:hypothetical protein